MKKFTLTMMTVLCFTLCWSVTMAKKSLAGKVGIQVDYRGNLISPGDYHYKNGVRFYRDGHKNDALIRFKFAAEFGHETAVKFIAFMYLEGDGIQEDLIRGLAWLKLSAGNGERESIDLFAKLEKQLPDTEKSAMEKLYSHLLQDYDETVVLNNVFKWYRRTKFKMIDRPNYVKFPGGGSLNEIQILRVIDQTRDFYIQYKENIGTVTLKDLEIDD